MNLLHKSIKTIIVIVLSFVLLISTFSIFSVRADDSNILFDNTNVLDDLKSTSSFDISKYDFSYSSEPTISIINVVEYCYKYNGTQDLYGLYLYLFNPNNINVVKESGQNKVQFAVSYDEYGNPSRYEKFSLKFCSVSTEYGYNNMFYKFKVLDHVSADGKRIVERVNKNERRYDINEFELLTFGKTNATPYSIGGTYKFTGFSKGCGPYSTGESTLKCEVKDFESLSLTLNSSYYRTNVSSLGKDHYNQVNTVYFSVPDRIFKTYGNLQKIHAEWWEYKTKMAAITSNYELYLKLLDNVDNYSSESNYQLYVGYDTVSGGDITTGWMQYHWDYVYNDNFSDLSNKWVSKDYRELKIIPYAFYSPTVNVDSVFSFLYSDTIAGDVESTQVKEWIYNYSNDLENGYIDCNGRPISIDLFEDSVDEGRTMGYNDKTIDLSDTFDLNSYDSNHSWWDKLWDYGFSWPATNGDYKNVAPIYEVKKEDLFDSYNLQLFPSDVSEKLLINKDDVSDLVSFFVEENKKNNHVILFRFSNTDYYCSPATFSRFSTETDTYVAQQTVFFDFDIIDLTFNRDGVYHVIPVVAAPIDIINDFTAPPSKLDWLKLFIALVLFILLIVLLQITGILPLIFNIILFIISLPFKFVGLLFKNKRQSKRKR